MNTETLLLDDVQLEINFYYAKGSPGSHFEPPEPEDFEIQSIVAVNPVDNAQKIDISGLFQDRDIDRIIKKLITQKSGE
jgi:hypothetical protein